MYALAGSKIGMTLCDSSLSYSAVSSLPSRSALILTIHSIWKTNNYAVASDRYRCGLGSSAFGFQF